MAQQGRGDMEQQASQAAQVARGRWAGSWHGSLSVA